MFINTIVWKSTVFKSAFTKNVRKLGDPTNYILFYSKGKSKKINNRDGNERTVYTASAETSSFLCHDSHMKNPQYTESFHNIIPKTRWISPLYKMEEGLLNGTIIINNNKVYKIIEKIGNEFDAHWDDCTGKGYYPTEKPFKLLERIILLSTEDK